MNTHLSQKNVATNIRREAARSARSEACKPREVKSERQYDFHELWWRLRDGQECDVICALEETEQAGERRHLARHSELSISNDRGVSVNQCIACS